MNDTRIQDLILLILRLGFGSMMILLHGWPKLEKLFWGDPSQFANPIGIGAAPTLALAVIIEVLFSIFLMVGLFTRISSGLLTLVMLVVVFVVKASDPLGEREIPLLYLFAFITLLIGGPGYYSLDHKLKLAY